MVSWLEDREDLDGVGGERNGGKVTCEGRGKKKRAELDQRRV